MAAEYTANSLIDIADMFKELGDAAESAMNRAPNQRAMMRAKGEMLAYRDCAEILRQTKLVQSN